jgi:hypothetical protein
LFLNENLLTIKEFTGEGYLPLVDFGSWRVAFLRYLDGLQPDRVDRLERHNETDEVFVLLSGQAVLFLGEGKENIERVIPQEMDYYKVYNVKRSAWHAVILSPDATILLVENCDTCEKNSEFASMTSEQHTLLESVSRQKIDYWKMEKIRT